MVRQNPTMAAAWLAIVLAAGAAQAQPFQIVSDGTDGVWMLDEASGEVSWCRLVTRPGAKLIDVFGADVQVREARERPARPECEVVRGPSATSGGVPSTCWPSSRTRALWRRRVRALVGGHGLAGRAAATWVRGAAATSAASAR